MMIDIIINLLREDEKIAELSAHVTWDWDLGQAYPVFNEYMTFFGRC